jgi:hypothetical protein
MDWMSDCMQWTKCAKPFDQAMIEFIGSEPLLVLLHLLKPLRHQVFASNSCQRYQGNLNQHLPYLFTIFSMVPRTTSKRLNQRCSRKAAVDPALARRSSAIRLSNSARA